ncbi:Hypothetical predicted protein [Lecanosticta acicola]|uniref:Autophagy-related protein 2 n=1 Tax=Lecanosticta acicola TaxID=111012 RepID=A0AAI8W0H0_9PEZI|nr:Hypothetical predicted protein [Lecanosticta acicola]
MSAWWQNKVLRYGLRYGLARTGLLEDEALDLDNLNITLGKTNVIDLKDVGLNIKRISQLAQLPPCLRLETARVLALRLIIPADFYQSSIVVEVDGVEIVARLQEEDVTAQQSQRKPRARSPATSRTPQHRKTNRRIPSPPPYDPGGSEDELHIPTTEEVAKSFMREEPPQERRELEALAANNAAVEESFVSESSEGGDIGTGVGVGVPGFLTNFLQGIVDRFKVEVKNVQVNVETDIGGEDGQPMPVTLRLTVGSAELDRLQSAANEGQGDAIPKRRLKIRNCSVALLSDATLFAEMSEIPSRASPAATRSPAESPRASRTADPISPESPLEGVPTSANRPFSPIGTSTGISTGPPLSMSLPRPLSHMEPYTGMDNADQFVETENEEVDEGQARSSILDIKPGDDNVSWGSRRSQASAPSDDLWKSMASEDDLPDSLIIQPGRSGTPKALSSHGSSPFANRRSGSMPLNEPDTTSSGSWPRLGDRNVRSQHSGGSWPTAQQSQHDEYEPLDDVLATSTSQITDNKLTAFERDPQGPLPETPPEPLGEVGDDMMESKLFSHDEAESMYMSAMTGSPEMNMPGGWNADAQSDNSSSSKRSMAPNASNLDGSMMSATSTPDLNRHSEHATPRAQSPDLTWRVAGSLQLPDTSKVVREVLFVDTVSVSIPQSGTSRHEEQRHSQQPQKARHSVSASRIGHGMPGTFSAYSEMSSSKFRDGGFAHRESNSILGTPPKIEPSVQIEVAVGVIRAQLDVSASRILYAIVSGAVSSFSSQGSEHSKQPTGTPRESKVSMCVQIDGFHACFREDIPSGATLAGGDDLASALLGFHCQRIDFSTLDDTKLSIGFLQITLGQTELLSFIHEVDTTASSHILTRGSPVVKIDVSRNRFAMTGRPIVEIAVHTSRLALDLDLSAVDEKFDCFGGISGMLELGSSILTEGETTSVRPAKPSKGVRFAEDSETPRSGAEIKLNGRVDGLSTTLRGPSCSMSLRMPTLKFVYREHGASAAIDQVLLSGPHLPSGDSSHPLSLRLAKLRVEYYFEPQDADLERLLSLITPSKDKYDNDNDILIDTLLRQRRKGAVLRVVIDSLKAQVDNWDCVSTLNALADDLAKLSAVTKYLPEDEKPGILTLLRLKATELELPINERFGNLGVTAQELCLAHVGLPALLAFSVGDLVASQAGGPQLVHSLIPCSGSENPPVFMARILGDEAEPIVKLKAFNLCAEYSVPVVLALTSMDEEMEPEEMINAMAQSVANLMVADSLPKLQRSPESDLYKASTKRTIIDLLIHDSAIGLSPQNLPSKALAVLHDVHLSTKIPPEEKLCAHLDLRKSSIFVCDHQPEPPTTSEMPKTLAERHVRLSKVLASEGYAQIGTIMSAKIDIFARDSASLESKTVEVDIKNDLLLLETCADSLHTLVATLGALAPPTPPNRDPKYLTEPLAIEDLLNSFPGEEVVRRTPQAPPQLLFDAENDLEDLGSDVPLGGSIFDADPDDMIAESAMTGSLYGPINDIYGMAEDGETESPAAGDYPETAESLLEDDPFEMSMSPDENFSDAALKRDLNRNPKPAIAGEAVELRSENSELDSREILDGGYDALGSAQQALGNQHRFNAPYIVPQPSQRVPAHKDLPFRLRVRDFNVIWHLYDGYDWQRTRDGIVEAVEEVEQKAEERKARRRRSRDDPADDGSVIGDFLFNSIYIGVPSSYDAQDLRRQINRNIDEEVSETASVPASGTSRPTTFSASGQPQPRQRRRLKLGRSKNHKITFELKGVTADVLVFPPGSRETLSSVDVRLRSFEIFDKVPTSTWRKFLTHMTSDESKREMGKPMFHIQLETVKTIESHAATEIRMHVSVLPLRLHVDQDALDFITRFFEFKDDSVSGPTPDSEKPYLQRVEVDTVDLCLDYKPKNVDYVGLRSGKTTEFMNFITLEAANIRLQHVIVYGLQGFEQLHPRLNDIWTGDVKRNQLPTIMAGLAPVRSLVNLGNGVKEVVAVPIAEYRRHGRIVQSIRAGGVIFGKTTTAELARLGAKVAMGTQTLLTTAEHMLSPTAAALSSRPGSGNRSSGDNWHDPTSASDEDEPEQKAISAYANQPLGLLSGLKSARRFLEHDLLTAKDALIAVQGEWMESRNPSEAAGAVARHGPTIILRPLVGAARATGTALLGVGNQIDRGNLRKVDDKYKPR